MDKLSLLAPLESSHTADTLESAMQQVFIKTYIEMLGDDLKDLFDSEEDWVQEIAEYVYDSIDTLIKVNGIFGIYEDANSYNTDEPRIGNYPEIIITSADEMFKAMEEGLTGWQGNHSKFYWDKDREEFIRSNITNFFKAHPDGIIEFG